MTPPALCDYTAEAQKSGKEYITATYRVTLPRWILNRLVTVYVNLGLPPGKYHLMTVRGRKSGRFYTTPVSVMKVNGRRWLVAPYGERQWVKNARAAGQVVLRRGRRSEAVAIEEELDPAQSALVLQRYVIEEPITRRFFDATPLSSLQDFIAEATRHPVFRIIDSPK